MTSTLTAKKNSKKAGAKSPTKGAKAKKSFPEALVQQYETIRKLIAKADRQDVQNRYQIAVHCLAVREGDGSETYGTNAVQKLANKLGWSKTDVYDYASVALAWPDKTKFDELAARPDKFDKPLTWTHFRRIAVEKDAVKREQLIQDCLRNGWSVRDLKRQMEGAAAPNGSSDGTNLDSKPIKGIAAVIHSYGSQVATFKQHTDKFRERFAATINAVDPTDCNDESLDQLLAVRTCLTELIEQFDAACRQYTERQKSPSTVPSAPESSFRMGRAGRCWSARKSSRQSWFRAQWGVSPDRRRPRFHLADIPLARNICRWTGQSSITSDGKCVTPGNLESPREFLSKIHVFP